MEEICKKKGENEATGDGSLMARNLVKDNTLKLRMEIQAAVERRRADTSVPIENSISLLMKDIWNVPSHIFGEHKICSQLDWPFDRHAIDESEVNNIPLLEATGIYSKVMKVVKDLSANVESLLFNTTNNLSECFNNIICKAISGKGINYTMRGSYTGPCAIASIKFTTKGALSTLYEGMKKHVPEEVTKMESERVTLLEKRKNYSARKYVVESYNKDTDKDYGPTSEKPDLPQDFYETFRKAHFDKFFESQ